MQLVLVSPNISVHGASCLYCPVAGDTAAEADGTTLTPHLLGPVCCDRLSPPPRVLLPALPPLVLCQPVPPFLPQPLAGHPALWQTTLWGRGPLKKCRGVVRVLSIVPSQGRVPETVETPSSPQETPACVVPNVLAVHGVREDSPREGALWGRLNLEVNCWWSPFPSSGERPCPDLAPQKRCGKNVPNPSRGRPASLVHPPCAGRQGRPGLGCLWSGSVDGALPEDELEPQAQLPGHVAGSSCGSAPRPPCAGPGGRAGRALAPRS